MDLVLKVLGLLAEELTVDGGATSPSPGRVTCLHNSARDHLMEEGEVVVLGLAELDKILAGDRALLAEKVDHDVALGRLEQH